MVALTIKNKTINSLKNYFQGEENIPVLSREIDLLTERWVNIINELENITGEEFDEKISEFFDVNCLNLFKVLLHNPELTEENLSGENTDLYLKVQDQIVNLLYKISGQKGSYN